jgi:hypothetical protein
MSLWTKTWSNNADALRNYQRDNWIRSGIIPPLRLAGAEIGDVWIPIQFDPSHGLLVVTNFRAWGWALRVSASNDTRDYFWRREFECVARERPANCIVHLELHSAGHTGTVLCGLSARFCVPQARDAVDTPADQLTITASLTYAPRITCQL